jgi:hypothetical protein
MYAMAERIAAQLCRPQALALPHFALISMRPIGIPFHQGMSHSDLFRVGHQRPGFSRVPFPGSAWDVKIKQLRFVCDSHVVMKFITFFLGRPNHQTLPLQPTRGHLLFV